MTEPIARIEKALTGLGAEHEPPLGWETRVLAAVATPKPRRWWWLAAPAVSLAVVAVVMVAVPAKPAAVALAIEIEQRSGTTRGDSVQAGDIVHATATGGGLHRAIWVYRTGRLEIVCPGGKQCRSSETATIVDITTIIGNYDIVALTSDSPLPSAPRELGAALVMKSAGVELAHEQQSVR